MEQRKEDLTQHQKEMVELRVQYNMRRTAVHLPNPTLGRDDDIEYFLVDFEWIAKQQRQPVKVWAIQLADLLTGKAMAAYGSLLQLEQSTILQGHKESDSALLYM